MPAMSDVTAAFIKLAIDNLTKIAIPTITNPVTHEQIEHMLIRPEHIEPLRTAAVITGASSTMNNVTVARTLGIEGTKVSATFRLVLIAVAGKMPPLLPTYASEILVGDDDPGVKAMDGYLVRRGRVSYEVATIRSVFLALNDRCASEADLLTYLPSLPVALEIFLATDHADGYQKEKIKKILTRLRKLKAPRDFTPLSREMNSLCVKTNTLITKFALYSRDAKPGIEEVAFHDLSYKFAKVKDLPPEVRQFAWA